VDEEMLDLAMHIIKTKAGRFDPEKFDDRCDAALLELIKVGLPVSASIYSGSRRGGFPSRG
jgi:non-homologous end joining protein Ku